MPSAIILSAELRESIETEVQEIRRALQDTFRITPNGTNHSEEESTTSSSSNSNDETTLTDQRLYTILSTHLSQEQTGPPNAEERAPSDEERCAQNNTGDQTGAPESAERGRRERTNDVADSMENATEEEYYYYDSSNDDVTDETYDDTEDNESSDSDGYTISDDDAFHVSEKTQSNDEDSSADEAALYHEGATELFQSLEEQDWVEATRILHHAPHQAKIWVVRTKSEAANDWDCHWKRLPLHEAVRQHAPFTLIDLLVQAYSGACRQCTQFGELPLHLALDNGLSPKIVHLLLLHHIVAFQVTDQSGRLPLELLHDARQLNAAEHRSLVLVFKAVEKSWKDLQGKHQRNLKQLEKNFAKAYVAETYSNASKVQDEIDKQNELKREIEDLKRELGQQKFDYDKKIHSLEAEKIELKKSLKASQIATARFARDMEAQKTTHRHEIAKLRIVLKRAAEWRSPQVKVVKNKIEESALKFVSLQETLSDHRVDLEALLKNIGAEPMMPPPESSDDSEEEWTD